MRLRGDPLAKARCQPVSARFGIRCRCDQTDECVLIPRLIPILTPQIREIRPAIDRKGRTQVTRDLDFTELV